MAKSVWMLRLDYTLLEAMTTRAAEEILPAALHSEMTPFLLPLLLPPFCRRTRGAERGAP